jgi:hypothetical protein
LLAAPVIDPFACAPVDVNFSGHNGTLIFTPLADPD